MAWEYIEYSINEEVYDIVAPPAEQAVIGDLQVVADTTDCENIQMGYAIIVYGGGDEYTNSIQYFDETEQEWIELPRTQLSPGGSGSNTMAWSDWGSAMPAGAIGPAVTFRPVGVDGDSITTASVANWRIRVRKQV